MKREVELKFIDEVALTVISGNGGPGCVSYRRESHVPRGGPDGGDGGKGGDVVFKVNEQLSSLIDLKYKRIWKAKNGEQGSSRLKSGKDGVDCIIEVPRGTLIKDEKGNLVIDLGKEADEFVLAYGGRGGKGNHFFKTSVNQAPNVAQPGEEGEEKSVQLELKLLADVGIIGFPNVGKSTLISRISSAKPKIADYEFTTLVPNLGVVKYGEYRSFVVADIPGLIKGASEGIGLGIQFLKHIERTKIFIHVIDVSGSNYRDPLDDYEDINRELKAYDEKYKIEDPLFKRKQIVVLNKIDSIKLEERKQFELEFKKRGIEVMSISSVTGENIDKLIFFTGDILFGKNQKESWE